MRRLKTANELFQQGLITQEDFDRVKKRVLDGASEPPETTITASLQPWTAKLIECSPLQVVLSVPPESEGLAGQFEPTEVARGGLGR